MKKNSSLLSLGTTNSKTAKNLRESLILYLAPLAQNSKGVNLCPKASAGCAAACLFLAGRGVFANVQAARIKRTELFLHYRPTFIHNIILEMNKKAAKVNGELAVRLNGTSDVKLVEMCAASGYSIASNIVFYDYTKIIQKAGERVLSTGHRYVVTFSRSEDNEEQALAHLRAGGIVAAVFEELPKYWKGFPVVDGDERDDLMLDIAGGTILGLKAKGKAKKDTSGFVVTRKDIASDWAKDMTFEDWVHFERVSAMSVDEINEEASIYASMP